MDPLRLINLVAEDNAIEDTIYHLHRALNTGRIDLERFLRVRAIPLCWSHFSFRCLDDPRARGRAIYEKGAHRQDPGGDADGNEFTLFLVIFGVATRHDKIKMSRLDLMGCSVS